MTWRVINPVLVATLLVVGVILLLWTRVVVSSDKPAPLGEVLRSYGIVIKGYFYPFDIPSVASSVAEQTGGSKRWYPLVWSGWFLCFLVSAQPYRPRFRGVGSVAGVLITLLWTYLVVGLVLVAGLRH